MIKKEKLSALFGGDDKLIVRFLHLFAQETPVLLKSLHSNIERENWDEVAQIAHTLKSQCAYLDLSDMVQIAYDIEKGAEGNIRLTLIPGLASRLEQQLLDIINREILN